MITFFILRQYNQMITALVELTLSLSIVRRATYISQPMMGLNSFCFPLLLFWLYNRQSPSLYYHIPPYLFPVRNSFLQVLLSHSFGTAILFINVVRKLFNGEHVSMIRNGNALHPVLHRLVDQTSWN